MKGFFNSFTIIPDSTTSSFEKRKDNSHFQYQSEAKKQYVHPKLDYWTIHKDKADALLEQDIDELDILPENEEQFIENRQQTNQQNPANSGNLLLSKQNTFTNRFEIFKQRNEPQKNFVITSNENPAFDQQNKRQIGPIQTIKIPIQQNPTASKQSNLLQFFGRQKEQPAASHSFLQKKADGSVQYTTKAAPKFQPQLAPSLKPYNPPIPPPLPVAEQKKNDIINLNDLSVEERNKIFKDLSKYDREKEKQQQRIAEKDRERKKLESLDNPLLKLQGQKQIEELLNEDNQYSSIKIEKRKPTESKRLSTFKQMFENNQGQSVYAGKPVFEYNRLLKYLFLKNYYTPEIADKECKVIPNKFQSNEEYCKIFEYLFLNEASAQLKQELTEFLKKSSKITKYRKLQIKIDESEQDKEGTIFVMRGPQIQNEISELIVQEKKKPKEKDSDAEDGEKEKNKNDFHTVKDGMCDLTACKNYIVLISTRMSMKMSRINVFKDENMLFFGIMIDPQKAQFVHQIKIQTFIERDQLNVHQWYNVFLFPFAKITTLIREYQMITQLNFKTPLASLIFNPNEQQHLIGQDIGGMWTAQFQNEIPNKHLMNSFFQLVDQKFNSSQAKSIQDIVLKQKGVCLLQGPPGTGKTHTLIGILSGVYEYMTLMNKFPKKKILICAPSNAAIDEIILRILTKGGLFDSQGNPKQAKIIRLGLLDEENDQSDIIKKVSLEDLAQHKLFSTQKMSAEQDQKTTADLRIELCQIQNQIKKLEKKLNQHGIPADERKQVKDELQKYIDFRKSKQEYLDKMRQSKRQCKESYNQFCEKLLNEAEILCSTLSSSGSDKLTKYFDQIDLLIVDEAAQCTEPSNIIPLRLGIQKMILIGDPKQLPATTFSQVSNQTLYNRSLFERILDNDFQPYFLDIQYRMQSEIRMFPSLHFYANKLQDHDSINQRMLPEEYFQKKVLFIDVLDGQEQRDGTSYINDIEASIVVELVKNVRNKFPSQNIGIICSYKSQVKHIKQLLRQIYQEESEMDKTIISVNTVDSFQGQEKDIIIFSCVRSSETGEIGFLNDGRRMNVALTRAKNVLLILGNAITLSKSELWKQMLINMRKRDLYRKLYNKSDFKFEKILKDEWEQNEKNMSQKLIQHLNQISSNNQEKITYNISDFKVEGTQNYSDTHKNHVKHHSHHSRDHSRDNHKSSQHKHRKQNDHQNSNKVQKDYQYEDKKRQDFQTVTNKNQKQYQQQEIQQPNQTQNSKNNKITNNYQTQQIEGTYLDSISYLLQEGLINE